MRKAAEAKAALDALNKSAADASATQLAGEEKLVAARRNEIGALKEEAAAARTTADAYKVYNVQALYGGRSDMQSHLSDMERQLQYETLLNRQRWLGFTTPQQAYAWRQNEYNQRLLMNRAEWAGYATADQYLQFVQRQTAGQRDLNTQMARQAELYKQGADAAIQYWNAVQGQAHRTTSGVAPVITPQVNLSGVQRAEAALAGLPDTVTTEVGIDDTVARAELAAWNAALRLIPPRVDVQANFDDTAAMSRAESFFAFIRRYRNFGSTVSLNAQPLSGGSSGGGGGPPFRVAPIVGGEDPGPIRAVAAAERDLASAAALSDTQLRAQAISQALLNARMAAAIPLFDRHRGFWGIFGSQIQLFGGLFAGLNQAFGGFIPHMLQSVSVLHVLLDGIVEITAVLIPAAVALTAFGIAATPTFAEIYKQMRAVVITSQALQQNIYPLTGGFQKMAAAVQPEVYVLFGEALVVMGKNTGTFTDLAQKAGKVIDDLGARIANALLQPGTGKFVDVAVSDLKKILDIFGNIFGTFGNILKVMPGYAEILLGIMDNLTATVERLSSSGFVQWLIGSFLAFHGFIVWAGLGATAAVALGNAVVGLAARFGLAEAGALAFNAVQFGAGIRATIQGVVLLGTELVTLGAAEDIAAAGAVTLEGVMAALGAINPLVWIGAAIAGIAVLVYWLARGAESVNQFTVNTQKALERAPITQLGVDLTRQYASALQDLAQTQRFMASAAGTEGQIQAFKVLTKQTKDLTGEQQAAADSTISMFQRSKDMTALLPVLRQDMSNYSTVLKAAGGNVALLNEAGLTSNDILTASKSQLQQYVIEVQAAADAEKALALGIGQSAAARNAQTNQYITEIVPAMQKVTQAEDNLLSILTGSETAIVAFQQALQTMGKDAQTTGAHLGDLHNQSLALTSDYYGSVIPALQKTADAMRAQNASQTQLTTVLATGAKEALAYAGHNVAARAVMVDLINNALGPGTVSLKNLNTWVKNNSTSLGGLSAIMAQVTIHSSQLASVLQNNLNVMLAQAAAYALGGQKALNEFAKGILDGKANTSDFVNGVGQQVLRMFQRMYQGDIPKAKSAFVDWAENGLGLSVKAAEDLWNELTTKTTPAMAQAAHQAQKSAATIDQTFVNSLKQIGILAPISAVNNFSSAILATGASSSRTAAARAQLIKDLESAGVQADAAKGMVNNLQRQIDSLKGKSVNVDLTTSGSGEIIIKGTGINQRTINTTTGQVRGPGGHTLAAGGAVGGSGGPTQDDQPIMASTGEWVINAASVGRLQRDYGPGVMHAINNYAMGGPVPYAAGGPVGAITGAEGQAGSAEVDFGTAAATAFAQAAIKAVASATAPTAGGGVSLAGLSGSSGFQAFQQVAARLGWTGQTFQDWVNVEMREAGFRLTATNPTSGAYGMAQFIQGPGEYYAYGGNPNTYIGQAVAMANYMIQRYGGPVGAWAHEQAFNWYAAGGPVVDAVKRASKDTRIREAMLLGSFLETDFNLNARKGDAYGPFLINLGKNPPRSRVRAAENPNWAAAYAAQWYDRAFQKAGGGTLWHQGHDLQGALRTADIAEHMANFVPRSPHLSASRAAGAWNMILGDLGLLNSSGFTTTGTSGPGISATSQDYASKTAALIAAWPGVVSAFSVLAHEPRPKDAKGIKLWPGWQSDLVVGYHAEGHIDRAVSALKAGKSSESAWDAILGPYGGALLNTVLTGHIPARKYWPAGRPSPFPWVGVNEYPKQLGNARSRFNVFLKAAQAAQKDWSLLSVPGEGAPVVPHPGAAPPPSTTASLVDIVPYATMGGPAIPVYSAGAPGMGFASGGQVGKVALANVAGLLSGFSGGGQVPIPAGGMSMAQVNGLLKRAAGGEIPARTLSEGASATRVGMNVENMTINNPVAEPPSTSITKANNRMAFLAGRGP